MADMVKRRRPATVSEQLRAALLAAGEAGVSRYRVAKETGVSQAALSRFARARQNLDLPSVDKLARFLELELTRVPRAASQAEENRTSKA